MCDQIQKDDHQSNSDSQQYDLQTLAAALDGLLLVSPKPLPLKKISEILQLPEEEALELVQERQKQYSQDHLSGLQIVILETGVQLATKANISAFIQKLDGQKMVSLSLQALETLSVIAFKQPITKAEIDAVRGVNSDGVISTLLEKKLIYISGEKQVLGRPRLYSTTQDFLYYFGMQSLDELPVPSVDIPYQLTPEGQKEEAEKDDQNEKELHESQGLLPIDESKTNISSNETSDAETSEKQS